MGDQESLRRSRQISPVCGSEEKRSLGIFDKVVGGNEENMKRYVCIT